MDINEISDLHASVTPGPWRWHGHVGYSYNLTTIDRGLLYIMGFKRLGMQGAQPTFWDPDDPEGYTVLRTADEVAVPEVSYRDDLDHFDSVTANYIASSWEMVDTLLRRVAELETELKSAKDDVSAWWAGYPA